MKTMIQLLPVHSIRCNPNHLSHTVCQGYLPQIDGQSNRITFASLLSQHFTLEQTRIIQLATKQLDKHAKIYQSAYFIVH